MTDMGRIARLLGLRAHAVAAATRRLAAAVAEVQAAEAGCAKALAAAQAADRALADSREALRAHPAEAPVRLLLVAARADGRAHAGQALQQARTALADAETRASEARSALVRLRVRHDALAAEARRLQRTAARAAEERQAIESEDQWRERAA